MQLGFAHRSFEAEQEPVVEARWIVDAILVEDQRVGERADLQQAMPVGVVPCQARDLQPHDDARVAHAHLGDQPLKAFPPGCRRARLALIVVDDDNLLVAPAECDGATAQRVLAFRALDVLEDLPHGGLPNVQVGAPFEMVWLDFERFIHGLLLRGWPDRHGGQEVNDGAVCLWRLPAALAERQLAAALHSWWPAPAPIPTCRAGERASAQHAPRAAAHHRGRRGAAFRSA